ncbi:MAG: AAA family ATPase [Planctomycetes bacterium]|nr:AAA family ATPase [Planctomycetota bacterium]
MSSYPSQEEVKAFQEPLLAFREGLGKVLFGQDSLIDHVIMALLAGGHVLLEGLPGLGKTELIKGMAVSLGADFRRIQFTPDLLPSDITGFQLFNAKDNEDGFKFQKGPLFAQLVLADEINRASPKTQSAMLEAMQEKSVTMAGITHKLPRPFFVMATQNPIELEGTYPLPEAQLDRFLFKLPIEMVSRKAMEMIIRHRDLGESPDLEKVMDMEHLLSAMDTCRRIYLPDPVVEAVSALVELAQPGSQGAGRWLRHGSGPRAALALTAALRAKALLAGRINASTEDIPAIVPHVFRHRLILRPEARMENHTIEGVINDLLQELKSSFRSLPETLTEANA